MVVISPQSISPHEILAGLESGSAGSLVMHVGVVRPVSAGQEVTAIEYQADREKAEKELSSIVDEARARWKIEDISLCRRTGKLGLGEIILVAAVSAAHRREGFQACEFAVERMKGMASIQKKEFFK